MRECLAPVALYHGNINGIKEIAMNKILMVTMAVAAVFGLSAVSCTKTEGGSGVSKAALGKGGTFTITDLPSEYNGMFLLCSALDYNATKDIPKGFITGCDSVGYYDSSSDMYSNLEANIFGTVIENGKCVVPLWAAIPKDETVRRPRAEDLYVKRVDFDLSGIHFLVEIHSARERIGTGINRTIITDFAFENVDLVKGSVVRSYNDRWRR